MKCSSAKGIGRGILPRKEQEARKSEQAIYDQHLHPHLKIPENLFLEFIYEIADNR